MKIFFKSHHSVVLVNLIVLALVIEFIGTASNNFYVTAASTATPTLSTPSLTEHCTDKNWTLYNSNCYRVFSTFAYFTTANQVCQNNGAYLVSIGNGEENSVIHRLVTAKTRYHEAWIGLRLNTKTNKHEWIDTNTKFQYSNWLYDEHSGDEQCSEITSAGMWSRARCYRKLQFVCEKAHVIHKEDNGNTRLIIMITLPLSCVAIMMLFVGYLCFRSHHEISSLVEQRRKCSQHFVDVVSNNSSIGTTEQLIEPPAEKIAEPPEQSDTNNSDDASNSKRDEPPNKDEVKYPERKTKMYSSPNGSEKVYKQVTFV